MGCNIKRVISFNQPVKWKEIKVFDSSNVDVTGSCLFSWSSDGVCWVNWTSKTTYDSIAKCISGDYFLRVMIQCGLSAVQYGDELTTCYTISIYNGNPYVESFCGNENLFNPYANLDCALLLQSQMADSIVCMFGIPCYYIKVKPDADSVDYTFKEYSLHNVESIKTLKLMCQDGELPSSNPQMKDFDFDWDNDWEVELGKTAFATAFGDDAFPKQRDMIYVPMMKRMYEVNSAYDEKQEGLMWRSTTWKLALVKWSEKTNVDQGDFEDAIDSLIVSKYDSIFGKESEEQRRQSGYGQTASPGHAATNLYDISLSDSIRKEFPVADKSSIVRDQLNNKSSIVAIWWYEFKQSDSVVTYQRGWCGDSGAILFLLGTDGSQSEKTIVDVAGIQVKLSGLKVKFGSCEVQLDSSHKWAVMAKWSKSNHTVSLEAYKHVMPDYSSMPLYKLRPEMGAFDFDNVVQMVSQYDESFSSTEPGKVTLSPSGCSITNLKIYETFLDAEESKVETLKHSTDHVSCVICDLARPVEAEHGYPVR